MLCPAHNTEMLLDVITVSLDLDSAALSNISEISMCWQRISWFQTDEAAGSFYTNLMQFLYNFFSYILMVLNIVQSKNSHPQC